MGHGHLAGASLVTENNARPGGPYQDFFSLVPEKILGTGIPVPKKIHFWKNLWCRKRQVVPWRFSENYQKWSIFGHFQFFLWCQKKKSRVPGFRYCSARKIRKRAYSNRRDPFGVRKRAVVFSGTREFFLRQILVIFWSVSAQYIQKCWFGPLLRQKRQVVPFGYLTFGPFFWHFYGLDEQKSRFFDKMLIYGRRLKKSRFFQKKILDPKLPKNFSFRR